MLARAGNGLHNGEEKQEKMDERKFISLCPEVIKRFLPKYSHFGEVICACYVYQRGSGVTAQRTKACQHILVRTPSER